MTRRLLVLAGAVALSASCREGTVPPVAASNPLADSADQMLFGVSTLLTDHGVLQAQLRADTGYFFDDNSRLELRNVHMTFHTNTGQKNAVLTSREGTYNTRLAVAEARGRVVVVTEDGRRLTTEQLSFNQTKNEISSDSAFVLTEPGRQVEGVGFVSDPNLQKIRTLGGTRGGGTFTLPGQ
jgi:LPS export ABC transporter protein LptC